MDGRKSVVVSALQFACSDDIATNVNTAERLVRSAHEKGANIILIQELFEGYYFCQAQREDFIQRAKPYKDHPTILRMQRLAKELGVVIPVSFFEEANNAHFNSIAIIDADGTDLGIYRKSHIPDGPGYEEKFYFNPGDTGFKVFETKFAKIGVAICWDQWFPEAARAMVLQGAEILFYPTAIGSEPQDEGLDSRDHWKRVMQGHAGANLVPLVASNRIGKEVIQTEHGKSAITFYGNSFIAGPTGEIVAVADDKNEAVLVAQFNLDEIKSKRHSWGIFRDRRPDLYKTIQARALQEYQATQKPTFQVVDFDARSTHGELSAKRSNYIVSGSTKPRVGCESKHRPWVLDTTDDEGESYIHQRPIGRDSAKKDAYAGSSGKAKYTEMFEKLLDMLDSLIDIRKQRVEMCRKKLQMEKDRQMGADLKALANDYSHLQRADRELVKQLQQRIREKYAL